MRHEAAADKSDPNDELLMERWLAEPPLGSEVAAAEEVASASGRAVSSTGSLAPLARSVNLASEVPDDLAVYDAYRPRGLPKLATGEYVHSILGGLGFGALCIALLHFGGSLAAGKSFHPPAFAAAAPAAPAAAVNALHGGAPVSDRAQSSLPAVEVESGPQSGLGREGNFSAVGPAMDRSPPSTNWVTMAPGDESAADSAESEIGSGAGSAGVDHTGFGPLRRGRVRHRRAINAPTLRFPLRD